MIGGPSLRASDALHGLDWDLVGFIDITHSGGWTSFGQSWVGDIDPCSDWDGHNCLCDIWGHADLEVREPGNRGIGVW